MIKDGKIKIVDFGLSFQQTTESQLANDFAGKLDNMAPEINDD